MTATYTLFINSNLVATVDGTEFAYEAWAKVQELAELLGARASMVFDEDQEVVAEYDPEEEDDDEPADIDSDEGFDPYEGCCTWDC